MKYGWCITKYMSPKETTGWIVVYDLKNAGPGVGIAMLMVETVVAALWLLTLVLKGMGFIS